MNKNFTKKWILNNLKIIDQMAEKRFPDSTIADDAANYVLDELESKNWLKSEKCNAKLSTYFRTVVRNAIENFSRKKFGRPRPPVWIKNKGTFWVEVFKKLCLERMSITDVLESMADPEKELRRYQLAEEAVYEILGSEINCRDSVLHRMSEIDDIDGEADSVEYKPDQLFSKLDQYQLRKSVLSIVVADDINLPEFGHIKKRLDSLKSKLKMREEDQVFLKLIYQDGLSRKEASQIMNWTSDKGNSLHRRLIEKISNLIEETGLKKDLLNTINPSFVDDYPK